jgi:hypothetical protein
MQGDGYFLRVKNAAPTIDASRPASAAPAYEPAPTKRKRHRKRMPFKVFPVLLLSVLLGVVVWAQRTEGGLSARIDDAVDWVRGVVEDAATDPGMKRATDYFNNRYANEGQYPIVSESDLSRDPDADFGVGVRIEHCSGQAIVLQSLTGGGTRSRLLIAGETYGEADGSVGCPANLADPQPFQPGD